MGASRYVWCVGLFTNLLLGNGTLKPKLRAALESEGVVLLEEGLPGTITYAHFKAPGRRHNGKVVGSALASELASSGSPCTAAGTRQADRPAVYGAAT